MHGIDVPMTMRPPRSGYDLIFLAARLQSVITKIFVDPSIKEIK